MGKVVLWRLCETRSHSRWSEWKVKVNGDVGMETDHRCHLFLEIFVSILLNISESTLSPSLMEKTQEVKYFPMISTI